MILTKEPQRTAKLHCHIADKNKEWAEKKKGELNVPIGRIIDALIEEERKREASKTKKKV